MRKPTAKVKALKTLAIRDHTEAELREKLGRFYDENEVNEAVNAVAKWLLSPEEMSRRMGEMLFSRGKGVFFINQKLRSKGLPPIEGNPRLELEKARRILNTRRFKDRAQAARHLAGRGFSSEIISKIVFRGNDDDSETNE